MNEKYSHRQKLIVPFIIFLGMIVVGVRSMYKGMLLHQNWRVALAAFGVVCFTTLLCSLVVTAFKQDKQKD